MTGAAPEAQDDGALGRDYHIVLVHGTFAPQAPWTQDGSNLRRALADALGNVTFHSFDWSGRNSYGDRREAGRRLAAVLDDIARGAPQAIRAVIAHSHGGNIALYAGKHIKSPQSLANLACLATPFIFCAPITKSLFGGVLLWALSALVVGAIGTSSGYLLSQAFMQLGVEQDTAALILLPLMLLIVAIGPIWLHRRLNTYLARSAKARLADLSWPNLPETRVLTVAYKFDEARSYLDYLDRASSRLSRRLWRNAELTLLVLAGAAFLSPFVGAMLGVPDIVDTAGFRGLEVPTIFLIYALVLVALALPLLRSNPYGYGWERLSNSWTLSISVVDRPDGLVAASIENWRIPIGAFRKSRELAHSLISEDPRVHAKLAEWLAASGT
jgi:hypothetical protein